MKFVDEILCRVTTLPHFTLGSSLRALDDMDMYEFYHLKVVKQRNGQPLMLVCLGQTFLVAPVHIEEYFHQDDNLNTSTPLNLKRIERKIRKLTSGLWIREELNDPDLRPLSLSTDFILFIFALARETCLCV